MSSQVNELNIIRQSLYELENQHTKIQSQYEDELTRVRSELHALRQNLPAVPGPPPPPHSMIGPGGSSLPIPSSNSGPLPPSSSHSAYGGDAFYRERERAERLERDARIGERDRDRERDGRDRERDRDRDRILDQRDAKRLKMDRTKSDRPGL